MVSETDGWLKASVDKAILITHLYLTTSVHSLYTTRGNPKKWRCYPLPSYWPLSVGRNGVQHIEGEYILMCAADRGAPCCYEGV